MPCSAARDPRVPSRTHEELPFLVPIYVSLPCLWLIFTQPQVRNIDIFCDLARCPAVLLFLLCPFLAYPWPAVTDS